MSKYRVILETKAIVHKWWGQMWCQNIDNYADFTNRLERGRAYIRSGRVHDLFIEKGSISAKVDGTQSEPYDVLIEIDALPATESKKLLRKIVNLNAFKDGFVPEDYKFLFSIGSGGLFPREDELSFSCSCPDVATMCKHIAAVLYAVGSIIDQEPLLLFQLRGIDVDAYLDAEIREKTNQLLIMAKNFDDDSRLIEDDLISEFFGIEIGELHTPERSYSVENTIHMPDLETRTIVIGCAPKVPRQKPPKEAKPLAPDRMVIRQFGLDGTYIAQYENYDEASEKTGVPKRNMQRNICGEKKSGGGFVWKKVPANTAHTNTDPIQYEADPKKKVVLGLSDAEIDSELKGTVETRGELDHECEATSSDADKGLDANNEIVEDQVYIRPFPKFYVGSAAFSSVDSKVCMSKVAQMKNGAAAFDSSFSSDAIKEIVLKKPRLFSRGYFQFIFKDDADIEIRSSNNADLDTSDISVLTKTSFNRNQANTICSFLNQLSADANLKITVL